MFSWNFSKSAEAMFSRWAIKRVCKFLLKKKLGDFILGDIDLNQLDVQLGAGTIQLSDLVVNVDYINEKLGTSPVLVKEGSVGSLTVTMPWKDGGCRIEVDELEVVIAPRRARVSRDEFETSSHSKNGNNSSSHGFRKVNNENQNTGATNASVDVHEGVKTIAKMVKWLLSSFHVKVKKLIVAFDPLLEGENHKGLDQILVLRISEAECGTHISEDASSGSITTDHNFLGLSRLTNFVKFQGAVLELLHVDGLDHQPPPEFSTETTSGNFSGYCSTGKTTTIISGGKGGFSGSLKLSLPWKSGSLDIRRVDADLHIEPLEIRLEPSTIRCFIFMWDLFKGIGEESEDPDHCKPSDSLSTPRSGMHPSDEGLHGNEGFVANCLMEKEPAHTLLSESHLISDWVSKSQDDRIEEPDFGASVDQFFECFDGLRNSQSALGNSGMWNWTCSVFSAITAASNLASGSLHVPSDQQHVETNFNAAIEKVSLLLSLIDEEHQQPPKMNGYMDDKPNADVHMHRLCAQLVDLSLMLQVHPREMNFEVVVQHVQVVDHMCYINDLDHQMHGHNENPEYKIASIQKMQDGVQGALLNFRESKKDPRVDHHVDISLSMQEGCCHMINDTYNCWKDSSVTLLKTSGVTRCHVRVNSGSSGGSLTGPTSFSLKLPPFVCWMNFDLITMMIEFLKEMTNCMETPFMGNGAESNSETKGHRYSTLSHPVIYSYPRLTNFPTRKFVEGDIFLPNARIILCFPLKGHESFSSYSSCNQFIAVDFISPTIGGKDVRSATPTPLASFDKRHDTTTSFFLNLHIGDFGLYSISSDLTVKIDGSDTRNSPEARFSALKIISAVNGTGHLSLISMIWQEGPVTGPWIAKKAKLLASLEHGKSDDVGKGSEFASVTTVRDSQDFDTRTRREMLATSSFILHGRLPPVVISLDKYQYENICCLLNQVVDHFSSVAESVKNREEHCSPQTSVLLECESVTVSVAIEPVGDVKHPLRSELPGSWINLTLLVDKFEFLSVFNIGGISGANFLWVTHGQGSLWGSITEGVQREFLLISCSDSTMGRGDGEGSNVLSSRRSGSDIINLSDPECNHNFTSVNIRCATIIAIGGRLDWFSTILSFFTPSSSNFEQAHDDDLEKACGTSFILDLVDVGLSYEPYIEKSMANKATCLKPSDLNTKISEDKLDVACLLAASSLKLSNTSMSDCTEREYKIRLQDLGLLICMIPKSGLVGHAYSVEHLSKTGYVKVAQEANVEALFRANCENGHAWELECSESHIMLNTCHDTTVGLIRLAAQLQCLFAPDMQDYVVHLENRWNNVQHVPEMTVGGEFSPSLSQSETSSHDTNSKIGNLMDEICEDVFQLEGNSDGQAKFFESHLRTLVCDTSLVASGASSSEDKNPEFIEEYFLSDLRPLSGLASLKGQSSDVHCCQIGAVGEDQIVNGGWYAGTPLNILENHASEAKQVNEHEFVEFDASTNASEHVEVGKAEGRVLLKNMNVIWRMNGGSDWSNFHDTSQTRAMNCPRDATSLELALTGIGCEFDVYPVGEISSSRLSLTVQDFYLYDRSDDAPWKLMLGNYHSKKHPRKFSSKAVKINLEAVKPDPSICIEENRLRIALLPMRLHLHQSQLDFLISFFGGNNSSADSSHSTLCLSKAGEPFEKCDNVQGSAINEAFLTYFQKFDIQPVLIRVDYSPCRVDLTALRGGKYVELVNLVPWKGVELQLKHVQGVGHYGWSSVIETILGEWLEDISLNQVHKLLKGLPPIKSIVAVGSGAAKLVSLPLKNYKKDHRLLKGMQRGTFAFLRSISLEAIGLGVHLAAGTHDILLQAEYILASIPPSVPWPAESKVGNSVKSNQPNDAQQGMQQACRSISDGLGKSASALVQTPLKKYQRGAGVGSALSSAVQSAPAAAIAPASAAARAVHCALLGFRNSLDPERKKESLEKYLGRTPPRESMQ